MPWPEIFFKAKKRPEPADAASSAAPANAPKVVVPPADAAVPVDPPAPVEPRPARPPSQPLPPPRFPTSSERSTRTLPVVHGVILRPPARSTGPLPAPTAPPEPMKNIEQLMDEADPVKTLSQTGSVRMLKRLTQDTAPVRSADTPPPIRAEDVVPAPEPVRVASAPAAYTPPTPAAPPVILPPKATEASSPWPSFPSKPGLSATATGSTSSAPPPLNIRKAEPIAPLEPLKIARPATKPLPAQPRAVGRESTILPRPAVAGPTPPPTSLPPPLPPMLQVGSIAKRKAKLADVARIILPPKREETGPLPSQTSQMPRPTPKPLPRVTVQQMLANAGQESPFMERPQAKTVPLAPQPAPAPAAPPPLATGTWAKTVPIPELQDLAETAPLPELQKPPGTTQPPAVPEVFDALPTPALLKPAETMRILPSVGAKLPERAPVAITPPRVTLPVVQPAVAKSPEPGRRPTARVVILPPDPVTPPPLPLPPLPPFVPTANYAAPNLDSALVFDPTKMPVIPPPTPTPELAPLAPVPAETVTATSPPSFESVPLVDAEAHKAKPEVLPKLDPEAHHVAPAAAPVEAPAPATEVAPVAAPGTREFHLTNGERVAGLVLSETPETVYVQHPSLGVLTIPRDEIATRLAEIILINGDRIVGNIMAETSDTLYVRHSSLGMLSVPKAQRSTRVIEAILKNGDRVLGEVVSETETFTVIKSATLGTVTVPHATVNMLNRKVEQVEMKALPQATLPDKK